MQPRSVGSLPKSSPAANLTRYVGFEDPAGYQLTTPQSLQLYHGSPATVEAKDFEHFARHLQDAAMFVYDTSNEPKYTAASVLLLRWKDDHTVEDDLVRLESLCKEQFGFRTEQVCIPECYEADASVIIKISIVAKSIQPNQLLIVYYAGYSFLGADSVMYWAR